MRSKQILQNLILTVLLTAVTSSVFSAIAQEDRLKLDFPYHGRDVGAIIPSVAMKGYYVQFGSQWEGFERGEWKLDTGEFAPLPWWEGGRELQVRQSIDGVNWSEWSTEPPFTSPGPDYPSTVVHADIIYLPAVLIYGNYVQVRHRVNTTNDGAYFTDGDRIGDWKVVDIEVQEALPQLDISAPVAVSHSYFRDFQRLEFTDIEFTFPDYFQWPHSRKINDEYVWIIAYDDGEAIAQNWDYPINPEWRSAYIQRLNYFRRMAGLTPTASAKEEDHHLAQRSATILHIMGGIGGAHDAFYNARDAGAFWANNITEEEAWVVKNSNLSSNNFYTPKELNIPDRYLTPIMEFMDDQLVYNLRVGHRKYLLSPDMPRLAIGGTDRIWGDMQGDGYTLHKTCPEMYVALASEGKRPAYTSDLDRTVLRDNGILWPVAGYVPYDLIPARFSGQSILLDIPELRDIEYTSISSSGEYLGIDGDSYWVQEENDIVAKVTINGVEYPVQMTQAWYSASIQELTFTFQFVEWPTYDPDNPVRGELKGLFEDLLYEDYPDHVQLDPAPDMRWPENPGALYFGPLYWASIYPRPRSGVDDIHVEIYWNVSAEVQVAQGLKSQYKLYEYDVNPFDPSVAFEDDYYAEGDDVLSESFGWYNASLFPLIYSHEQGCWMYSANDITQRYLYNEGGGYLYDFEIGWLHVPNGSKWVYSFDRDQWMWFGHLQEDGGRLYVTASGEVLQF